MLEHGSYSVAGVFDSEETRFLHRIYHHHIESNASVLVFIGLREYD
jgi:hypothetical protein